MEKVERKCGRQGRGEKKCEGRIYSDFSSRIFFLIFKFFTLVYLWIGIIPTLVATSFLSTCCFSFLLQSESQPPFL